MATWLNAGLETSPEGRRRCSEVMLVMMTLTTDIAEDGDADSSCERDPTTPNSRNSRSSESIAR